MTDLDATGRVDPSTVMRMSKAELDALFRRSPPGPIPVGQARGTAIILPGSLFDRLLAGLIRLLIWQGKVFSPQTQDLRNLIGPLGFHLIRAKVYADKSWFADGQAIILDYSQTSLVAKMIRDEIRQIGPGVYLGQVYWARTRIALFMLEFPVIGAGMPAGSPLTTLSKLSLWICALLLAAGLIGGTYLGVRLRDDKPVTYTNIEDHFKHGSTGGERGYGYQLGFGIPYWIWVAMPELFSQYLPDSQPGRGYTAFGMIYEDGKDPRFDLPVGMSMRRVQGVDRVYFNCASCHTGTLRDAPGAPRQIVLGMPANTLNLGAIIQFLNHSAGDWKFQASRMMPAIEDMEARQRRLPAAGPGVYRPRPLGAIDAVVFRYVGISLLRDALLGLTSRLAFINFDSWGPGRVDTFNAPKALLGFPMQKAPPSELVGNADFPAVWNQKWKDGLQLHWDGNNTRVDERNLSAAFGTGATPTTLDKEKVLRMAAFLWDSAHPPDFPARYVRPGLAAAGASIYHTQCWSCHGNGRPPFHTPDDGGRVGAVTPISEVGTDRSRLDSYTPVLAAAQNSLYAGYPADADVDWCADHPRDTDRCYPARFSHFRKTNGYANMPLDGIWLRAPYLHNGSVPDLRALLEPASSRPPLFYIGYDVYDYERVGFVTQGTQAERHGWRYDTHARGNGNGGHQYGTHLSAADKAALIEYLKTF